MKTIVKILTLTCILFACQLNAGAQTVSLGRQKQSFSYKSLYRHSVAKEMNVVENTTPKPIVKETPKPVVTEVEKPIKKEISKPVVTEVAQPVAKAMVEPIGKEEANAEMASEEEIQRLQRAHKQLNQLCSQTIYDSNTFDIYCRLYKSAPQTKENVQTLMKIQMVVLRYYTTQTTCYPDLAKRLKGSSSLSEQKNILLSYSK
jgi:hypothetical protein